MEENILLEVSKLTWHELTKHGTESSRFVNFVNCLRGIKPENTEEVRLYSTDEPVEIQQGKETDDALRALEDYIRTGEKPKDLLQLKVNTSAGEQPMSNFAKTSLFGGGKGSGGGTAQTRTVEAGQCIVCALNISSVEEIQGKFPGNSDRCILKSSVTQEHIWEEMCNLPLEWKKTLIRTKEHIYESIKGSSTTGYFHWQDSFVKNIGSIYSKLEGHLPGSLDRWNPADIWYSVDSKLPSFKNETGLASEFTEQMNEHYKQGTIVGISLKSLEGVESRADLRQHIPDLKVSNIILRPLAENSTTLNISFIPNFNGDSTERWLVIRAGNYCNLRAELKPVGKKGNYKEGGCTDEIILHCLEQNLNLSKEQLKLCIPKTYLQEGHNLSETYILNHPGSFTLEELEIATALGAEESVQDVCESYILEEKKLEPKKYAVRKALEAISHIFSVSSSTQQEAFVKDMLEFCMSIKAESALHIVIH